MSYKCFVAQITRVQEIPGADKIHCATVLGSKVVVAKDWGVGYVGLFFPVDTQLSEEFCKQNNLYRDCTKNADTTKKGFFDDNRRVRAQPFMKVKSEGFFCGIDSLDYIGYEVGGDFAFLVGDSFDNYAGYEVCKRYESEKASKIKREQKQKAPKAKVAPTFHKHCDSEQFKLFAHHIKKGSLISIHAKVHGTSARYACLPVTRETHYSKPVSFLRKLVGMSRVKVQTQYEHLVGTRNVTLLEDQRYNAQGFHGSEEYRYEILDLLKPHIEKGMTVYGEIAGYANGKTIMPKHSTETLKDKAFNKKYGKEITYKYGCNETQYRFHVYRITYQTVDGKEIDFTPAQLEEWCLDRGINHHYNVVEPFIYDGDVEKLSALVESLTEREDVLTEDYIDPSHVSEGVIVRVDCANMRPIFYKNKSYAFRVMEGISREEVVDIEEIS